MRILRVRIPGYGPLHGVELEPEPGLNLIYGPNEAGKTALLDFLLGHLFRREGRTGTQLATVMRGVDRFPDPATAGGGVELRLDGDVLAYPGTTSLLDRLGLEYTGLSGLFCVRSGELDWPGDDDAEFWSALKRLLSGLPEGVDTLREAVHAAAGVTAAGTNLLNRGERRIRDRHAGLEARVERLLSLRERLEEAYRKDGEIADLEHALERLDRARRERTAVLFGELEEAEAGLERLPRVPGELLEEWDDRRRKIRRREEEIRVLERELREAREARARHRDELAAAREEARELERRVDRAEARELEARAREIAAAADPAEAGPDPGLVWGGAGVVIALCVLAAGLELLALPLAAGASLLAAAFGAAGHASVRRRRREAEGAREVRLRALLEDAASAGLEADEAGAVPAALRRLRALATEAARAVGARERDLAHEEDRVAAREEALEEAREAVEDARAAVEDLRERLGVDALEEARSRAREREKMERRVGELKSALREHAGPDRSAWRVEPPEAGKEEELPEWNAGEQARAEARLREARRAYQELRDAFRDAGLEEPEDVLAELQRARSDLRSIELDREAGLLAGRVFGTMDEALEARLRAAVEADGDLSAGGLLRRVARRYRSVRRGDGADLEVVDGEGRTFPVGELSRGTRDQVYVAVRVGLARAALAAAGVDEPGFLLLDDAFLTADWERRERLVASMADLAAAGWQVVYLTCDDHLRELHADAGARVFEL